MVQLKEEKPAYKVWVNPELCIGEDCAATVCARAFSNAPG